LVTPSGNPLFAGSFVTGTVLLPIYPNAFLIFFRPKKKSALSSDTFDFWLQPERIFYLPSKRLGINASTAARTVQD
jgi:hypothetical protein